MVFNVEIRKFWVMNDPVRINDRAHGHCHTFNEHKSFLSNSSHMPHNACYSPDKKQKTSYF